MWPWDRRRRLSLSLRKERMARRVLRRLRGKEKIKKTVTLKRDDQQIRLFRIQSDFSVTHARLARGLTVWGDGDLQIMPSGFGSRFRFVEERSIGERDTAVVPDWLWDEIPHKRIKASSAIRQLASPKTAAAEPGSDPSAILPPQLAPFIAPAGRSRTQYRAAFAATIQGLKQVMTKPISEFAGIADPTDLQILANLLNQIAATAEKMSP